MKQAEDKGGGKGSKRKNAADARALEIEYLEGELQALAEKEREEVGAGPCHLSFCMLVPLYCSASCACHQ